MSAIVPHNPLIVRTTVYYLTKILKWRQYNTEPVGMIFKVDGFDAYNKLIDVNAMFSTMPNGMPVDRTGQVTTPVNFQIDRPWQVPTEQWSLEQAMQQRVLNLISKGQRINILWSGGIDSTAMVVAFLQNLDSFEQIRILYSPYARYEHPGYIENFLVKFPGLELVDISGDAYLNTQLDGIFITGDGGDELTASIDESFFNNHGPELLHTPWQDYFYKNTQDDSLIEFCDSYFKSAGRPIDTVLEARWWFYAICKNRFHLSEKCDLYIDYKNFDPNSIIGFYDCNEYENFIYWNIDQCITGNKYTGWKEIIKQYAVNFDGQQEWYVTKQKTNSFQANFYARKNIILKDCRYIFLLENGTRIATPNLPLLGQNEFEDIYGSTLDYLFNEPN